MSSPPPHLLTIPREIRNIIYTHLTQDIHLDWGYKIRPFPLGGHYAARLRSRNAPLLNVLLSCTQIYDEYSQSSCFKKPTVAIPVGTYCTQHLLENQAANQVRALQTLQRITHVDFHVNGADQSGPRGIWATIDELSQAISVLAPSLESIKVVASTGSHEFSFWHLGVLLRMPAPATMFALSPPVLAGRPIPHGKEGFWNRDSNPENFFQGREAGLGAGNFMAGEWHFVRGKRTEHIAASE